MTKHHRNNHFLFIAIGMAGINLLKTCFKNKPSFNNSNNLNNITNNTFHNEPEPPLPGKIDSSADYLEL